MPDDKGFAEMLEDFEAEDVQENEDVDIDDIELGDLDSDVGDSATDTTDLDDDNDDADTDDSDELALLKTQLADRDKTIADIAKGRVEAKSDDKDDAKGFQLEETDWEASAFVDDDFDMQDLTPIGLNELLNKAAAAGAKIGAKTAAEQVILSIPGIVKHNVSMQSTIQTAVSEFYAGNSDLLQFKGAVSSVAQELASKNPAWELGKLFNEAGIETRSRLGIKKPKKKSTVSTNVKPKGQRGRHTKNDVKGLEKELDDMLKV